MTTKYAMTIGGEQVSADNYTEVRNPANTEEIVGLAPIASEQDLDRAMAAAEEAFQSWRHSSDEERAAMCQTIADVIEKNSEELALLLSKEQGKALQGPGAHFELQGCVGWCRYTAGLSLPVKILEDSGEKHIELRREPLGVVASITPWNWPLMIAIWHIIPAIRTGNTVVIKPSPYTPLSTLRMIELINQAIPAGMINTIAGSRDIGAKLSKHPGVGKIVFTGSTGAGRQIGTDAAQNIVPVTLELGGNDAGILLPGIDAAAIAEGLFWGSMINTGQTCAALKRLYVHEDDYEAVCKALVEFSKHIPVGDGAVEGNLLGPVQNASQFNYVMELVADARANGADILCGGEPVGGDNYLYPVTFVGNIEDGSRLVDEEQFGPVLPIIRYRELDDALAAANALDFGLAASVWGSDEDLLEDAVSRLEAGTVYVNQHGVVAPHVPFGGIKDSGVGVEFGEEGLAAYTSIKVVNAAR